MSNITVTNIMTKWYAKEDIFNIVCQSIMVWLLHYLKNALIIFVIFALLFLNGKNYISDQHLILIAFICYCIFPTDLANLFIFDFMKNYIYFDRFKDKLKLGTSSPEKTSMSNVASNIQSEQNLRDNTHQIMFSKWLMIVGERGSGKAKLFKSLELNNIRNNSKFRNGSNSNQNIHVYCVKSHIKGQDSQQPPSLTLFGNVIFDVRKKMDNLHALLYCFSLESGFTKQDLENINSIEKKFGKKFVKRHLMLVIVSNRNSNEEFEQLLRETGSGRLQSTFQKCNYRCIQFKKEDGHHYPYQNLLEMVEKIKHDNATHVMDSNDEDVTDGPREQNEKIGKDICIVCDNCTSTKVAEQLKQRKSERINANDTWRKEVLSSDETDEPYSTATQGSTIEATSPTTSRDSKDDITPFDSPYSENDPVNSQRKLQLK